jgi:alpha-tubulin suppressor-like RCC1 family protein
LHVAFKRVFTSHSGCHAVFIDVQDRPWREAFFAFREALAHSLISRRKERSVRLTILEATSLSISGSGQLGTKDKTVWEPVLLADTKQFPKVPDSLRHAHIVHAACGRAHTILVTSDGEAYASGQNNLGQCAQPQDGDIFAFAKIEIRGEKVVQAACGVSFSLLLTASGKVFAFGSPQYGQLGHGRTGESIRASKIVYEEEREPLWVERNLKDKKVVQIACGQTHSLAYVHILG